MKKVEYLIVGQGIAGTLLALKLMEEGRSVFILNKETENTSSNKAAGLYNPITGRQMVKTWMADVLFENIESHYKALEATLSARFLYPKSIYRPFYSVEEQNDWQGKIADPDFHPYVKKIHTKSANIDGISDPHGGLELKKCGYVDLPTLIEAARKYFTTLGIYQPEVFEYHELVQMENGISYKNILADRIVFCDGPDAVNNPHFSYLPFKPVKGELLEIKTELEDERIINRGVFMLPRNGVFRVGSTYDHSALDHVPSESGKKNLVERLAKLYGKEYIIVNHTAGVRPATYDRKPFIGLKKENNRIGIFNGFGTKGVSLVPFFATQFVNYLLEKDDLSAEVSIHRVDRG